MAIVTFIGNGKDDPDFVRYDGMEFPLNEAVEYDGKLLGMFTRNSHFKVGADVAYLEEVEKHEEPDIPAEPEAVSEKDQLKAELDKRGIAYRANASLKKLRGLIDGNENRA